jgi:hypothetical protein
LSFRWRNLGISGPYCNHYCPQNCSLKYTIIGGGGGGGGGGGEEGGTV